MNARIELLSNLFEQNNLDVLLITSPYSVQYFSGYFFNFETGPSPFQFIPVALYVTPSEGVSLIIADNETGQFTNPDSRIQILSYESYSYDKPLDFTRQFLNKLSELIRLSKSNGLKLGIEPDFLPVPVFTSLISSNPKIEFTDISLKIQQLRMIKDELELAMIHAATHLCDTGQEAVLKYAKPGMTELELFNRVRGEMESMAGQRVPMMADMVCGSRTADGGGNPSDKIIKTGDLIISDITPCLNGYWGDTCNTVAIGKPSEKQKEQFLKIKETLDLAIESIRPGITAAEVDRLMRRNLERMGGYNHHSGHGVGLAYHEEPRIIPYNNTVLEPNMVIALEPGLYMKDYGIRLEHLVVVTTSGCELISRFNHCFEQS